MAMKQTIESTTIQCRAFTHIFSWKSNWNTNSGYVLHSFAWHLSIYIRCVTCSNYSLLLCCLLLNCRKFINQTLDQAQCHRTSTRAFETASFTIIMLNILFISIDKTELFPMGSEHWIEDIQLIIIFPLLFIWIDGTAFDQLPGTSKSILHIHFVQN